MVIVHYTMLLVSGHIDTVELFVLRGADLSLCDKVSVIVNW